MIIDIVRYIRDFALDSLLIVRLHPRLGSDSRGHSAAKESAAFIQCIQRAVGDCNRIRLVLPNDQVNSYLIGYHSDLVFNPWSLIGSELSIFWEDCY